MKRFVLGILTLCLPVVLQAQVTIQGKVVDQQSGAPVVGAAVAIPGTGLGALTDQSGAFSFTSPTAVSSVHVSRFGYVTKDVAVTGSAALTIQLTPQATELAGVQVVANKPTPSTVVITRTDLEKGNGISLEGAINSIPGLFMQSRSPFGGARITIRGYYPSTTGQSANFNGLGYQVFLNDIPVTDATGTSVLDDIDYATLGRVDVTKGPASSEWGSFIGGAIRFTTLRPPMNQTSLSQQVESGTNNLLRSTSTFQTANDHSDITVNYGHQQYDSFRPHSASGKEFWRANGDFVVGDNQTVSGFFGYTRSFEELAGEIDTPDFYARRPVSSAGYLANDSHVALTTVLAGISDHYRINDHFSNQTAVFTGGKKSGQPFAHGFTDVNQFNMGFRSVFDYAAQLGDGVGLTGNLGGMMQQSTLSQMGVFIVPAPPNPQRPNAQENYAVNTSLFTEWNLAVPGALTFTVGGSLNRNVFSIRNMLPGGSFNDTTVAETRTFDWTFTPRVAVTKGIGRSASVYASVSTGYTPPLLGDAIASDGTVNLGLKPERAVQYEVGTQGSFMDDKLSASLALFDLENNDKLVAQRSGAVSFTTNAGKQRNQGLEASLSLDALQNKDGVLTALRPWVSYAYTNAKFVAFKSDNNNDANTVDYSGNFVPRVPKNTFAAGVDADTHVGVSFSANYQQVDQVPVTLNNDLYVKGYGTLGARVGYKTLLTPHWQLNLFAGGTNLTSATSYAFLFVGPNAQKLSSAVVGGTGDGYIIPAPYNAQYYGNVTLRYIF
ncbi:MAG TPA: TonB-dependent receptor [Gemmatimonadaceae bacterium]|nr:TonB-dependent receptor [Gemmatimonadaceae bacterium]